MISPVTQSHLSTSAIQPVSRTFVCGSQYLPHCPCLQQLLSVLQLLKSNLRFRVGKKRLSSLTLAYIYSDSFDYRSIAADVVEDFFLTTLKLVARLLRLLIRTAVTVSMVYCEKAWQAFYGISK